MDLQISYPEKPVFYNSIIGQYKNVVYNCSGILASGSEPAAGSFLEEMHPKTVDLKRHLVALGTGEDQPAAPGGSSSQRSH